MLVVTAICLVLGGVGLGFGISKGSAVPGILGLIVFILGLLFGVESSVPGFLHAMLG